LHIAGFTGIDSVYERPAEPEVSVKAGAISIDECVQEIVAHLVDKVCNSKTTYSLLYVDNSQFLFTNSYLK